MSEVATTQDAIDEAGRDASHAAIDLRCELNALAHYGNGSTKAVMRRRADLVKRMNDLLRLTDEVLYKEMTQ
jgi:hypothetical protein